MDDICKKAETLIQKKSYFEAYEYIQNNLLGTEDSLKMYNYRNKCLSEMGRQQEMHLFPWEIINYRMPEQEDMVAVSYIAEAMQANNWMLEHSRFSHRHKILRNEIDRSAISTSEKEYFSEAFRDEKVKEVSLLNLSRHYYGVNDVVKAIYYHALYLKGTDSQDKALESEEGLVLSKAKNSGDLYSALLKDYTDTIAFVIDNKDDYDGYFQMAKACKYFGKKAIFITAPIEWEIEGEVPSEEDSLRLMYENTEIIDGVECMTTINYYRGGKNVEGTLLSLLNDLSKKAKGNQLLLFAERRVFRAMKSLNVKRNAIHYVAANDELKNAIFNTNFGYINGYANHESMLFGINVIKEIKKDSKFAFSIVIPVRNNSETLEYTLKTCIEQDYKDYEILVCDNSDDGNTKISEMLKSRVDSEKIRYIKTPRVLPISKSFEFAYLKAKGDFLLPLGADDGLIFNSLKYLDVALTSLEKKNKVNILTWDRLHYVWPSLKETGQESQFVIPEKYIKGELKVEKRTSYEVLKEMLRNPIMMYSAPLSYINSGMKRQYLEELLERSGAMIDGHSQDLYTGIVNLALNKEYYHLGFPITIAALSGYSSGAQSIIGLVNDTAFKARENEFFATNIATPAQRDSEDLFMVSDGDVANLISQVFRLIDMECIDLEMITYMNWENIGRSIIKQLQAKDVCRKKVMKTLLTTIAQFSGDAADKLEKLVKQQIISYNRYDLVTGKRYFRGFTEKGELHLDASAFKVSNVYEACNLFNSIYNIY